MSSDTRKRLGLFLGVFFAALIGCGIGCVIAINLSHKEKAPAAGGTHDWLHEQLGITAEQHLGLEQIEARFAKREAELVAALATAKSDLGDVMAEDKAFTPRVTTSIEKIHHAMAELQKATLEHLFEMEEALTPEQYDLLIELASESLFE